MNGTRPFFDTNVLIYLASADLAKAIVAERVLKAGGAISVQVLNEFISVARRKMLLSWASIAEFTRSVRLTCDVIPLTLAMHDHAVAIAQRYRVPIYDATIVAAAIDGGCSFLLSEDFQHGQLFERQLSVCDPFVGSA